MGSDQPKRFSFTAPWLIPVIEHIRKTHFVDLLEAELQAAERRPLATRQQAAKPPGPLDTPMDYDKFMERLTLQNEQDRQQLQKQLDKPMDYDEFMEQLELQNEQDTKWLQERLNKPVDYDQMLRDIEAQNAEYTRRYGY